MIRKRTVILIILTSISTVLSEHHESEHHEYPYKGHGPTGMDIVDTTTCDEFSQNARFSPYSILDSVWFAFYFWAHSTAKFMMSFYVPTAKELRYLKYVLDSQVKEPINWTARHLVMRDLEGNHTFVLTERNDRGMYWAYLYCYLIDDEKMEAIDLRFKQTSDNKYLALMSCDTNEVYVLSRMKDIPKRKHLQDAAAKIGYRSRKGRSYLYQGHEWMPIGEMDDEEYWAPHKSHGLNFS